jgi:hypothetical protein
LVGINGTGKTTCIKKLLEKTVTATNRALIVTPDPAEWRMLDEVSGQRIATFNGIKKIIYHQNCMAEIQRYYSNGMLVFDDARVYIHAQSNDFMQWLQIRRRQAGIDLFCNFHGLTQVPPVFFTFATNLVLFYTKDNIKRRAEYIDEQDFDDIQDAKERIAKKVAAGDPYAYEIITLDKRFAQNG